MARWPFAELSKTASSWFFVGEPRARRRLRVTAPAGRSKRWNVIVNSWLPGREKHLGPPRCHSKKRLKYQGAHFRDQSNTPIPGTPNNQKEKDVSRNNHFQVKDFNCHIGTTMCFWLFGVPGTYIHIYIYMYTDTMQYSEYRL